MNPMAIALKTPTFKTDTLEKAMKYYWKVIAKDNSGKSYYSSIWSFTTSNNQVEKPLKENKIILISPKNKLSDVEINTKFEWQLKNMSSHSNFELVVVVDNESFKYATTQCNYSLLLKKNKKYEWYVIAKSDKEEDIKSSKYSFSTSINSNIGSDLEAPELLTPKNNSNNESFRMTMFGWRKCKNSTLKDTYYTVMYSQDNSNWVSMEKTYKLNSDQYPDLKPNTKYYWKVVASNGKSTVTSQVFNFSTVKNTPPDKPILTYPENNSIDLQTNIQFAWLPVSDHDIEPVSYVLTLQTVDSIKEIKTKMNSLLVSLKSNTSYSWFITAKDANGGVTKSEVYSFKTKLATENTNTIEMIEVQGGKFVMGSNNGEEYEKPEHNVILDDFLIGKYEITHAQYIEFLNSKKINKNGRCNGETYVKMYSEYCAIGYKNGKFIFKGSIKAATPNHPMMEVTWCGAKAFCEWAGGRLPTEAEWEYAARGGVCQKSTIYAGSNDLNEVAQCIINNDKSAERVGTKKANELGIFDMSGNVWEWCNDKFDKDYYSNSPKNNPKGPDKGIGRIARGGSYSTPKATNSVFFRNILYISGSHNAVGFRLVRDI